MSTMLHDGQCFAMGNTLTMGNIWRWAMLRRWATLDEEQYLTMGNTYNGQHSRWATQHDDGQHSRWATLDDVWATLTMGNI